MAAVGTALLAGKMRVPARRAGDVPRPRLAERLAAAWRTPLTVLSAPAGFGKSTLVTQWLAAVPNERVAWVALDEGDNDPRRFWTYVITALQQAVDGIGATALDLLASSSVETALAPLLNELTGLPADLLLVLDDYHLVESAEIHESMAYLLDHQPPDASPRADHRGTSRGPALHR
jgi:LuxR family maltose regulon positive regulatory protein